MGIFLLVLALIGIALLLDRYWSRGDKHRIEERLAQLGATDIEISREWYTWAGIDAHTYAVTYRDSLGHLRHNECKIFKPWLHTEPEICWRDPF